MSNPLNKLGQRAADLLKDWLNKSDPEKAATPAEGGPSAPVDSSPDAGAAAPTGNVPPEQSPLNPATGAPVAPPMTQKQIDEGIQRTGPAGEIGPMEAAALTGRTPRRNINLDFFDDDSTKQTIEYFNYINGGFTDNEKRRVVTHAETIKKSVAGATDVTELKKRMSRLIGGDINDKWEPEDIVGIYHMMEKQAEELQGYAAELKAMRNAGVEPSKEDLAHYQLLATRFTTTQEIASVRAAEAGRMLNALQAVSKTGGKQYYDDLDNIVRGAGGEHSLWVNIDRVADAKNLKDISAAARQGFWAKTYHTAVQLRYNAMLSSMRTHAANVAGSAATGVYENLLVNPTKIAFNNAEYGIRAMVQATFGKGGMRPQDRIALAETITSPADHIGGIRAGFANAKKVFSGELMGHGKVYNEMGIHPNDPTVTGGGALPESMQIPTRLLEAEDAFFRSIYGNARLSQLAKRKALQNAEDDMDVDRLYQSYMRSPPPDMLKEAQDYAGKLTFTNDPSLYGSVLGTLAKTMSTVQDHPVGRLIVPFVRTPMNLLGYALDNTAVGKLMGPRKLMQDMKNPETRADAEARIAIAAGLYAYLHSYWEEGKITGAAPSNYGVFRAREAAGWRENAIRIGDEYYELDRMDPLGLVMAMYATAYETNAHLTEKDQPTAAAASIVTVASMLTDRSVLSGLGDLERVFKASEGSVGKQGGKFIARVATSFFIPAAMRDIREGKDRFKRALEVRPTLGGAAWDSVVKSTMNAVPFLSEKLPPRVDAFGKDMVSVGNWAYRAGVPIRRGEIKQDPVTAALIATAAPVNKPDYLIGLPGGPRIDLLAVDDGQGWVYRAYQQDVGRARYQALKKLTNTASFRKQIEQGAIDPDSPAGDLVRRVLREARRTATLAFMQKFDGKDKFTPTVDGEQVAGTIELTKPISLEMYKEISKQLQRQGPTDETMDRVREQGYKYQYKPEQRGLPEEMRF